jgi:hypothetical protein
MRAWTWRSLGSVDLFIPESELLGLAQFEGREVSLDGVDIRVVLGSSLTLRPVVVDFDVSLDITGSLVPPEVISESSGVGLGHLSDVVVSLQVIMAWRRVVLLKLQREEGTTIGQFVL